MGNQSSKGRESEIMYQQQQQDQQPSGEQPAPQAGGVDTKAKYRSFPGSAFLEKTFCGSIDTTDPAEYEGTNIANRLLKKADIMCVSSPVEDDEKSFFPDSEYGGGGSGSSSSRKSINPSSALLARALVSEVTDNPKTMKPAEMTQREYKLLKAQEAASKREGSGHAATARGSRPVGAPGGIGPPSVLNSFAYACTGDENAAASLCAKPSAATSSSAVMPPGPMQENRAMTLDGVEDSAPLSPYAVTIGLCMSRRHSVGHPETVTRQSTYDFNELQDRQYKYVSSTDKYGWRAGGGEKGGPVEVMNSPSNQADSGLTARNSPSPTPLTTVKEASIDKTHIPIIHIDCPSAEVADQVIHAMASGDIFIPHMSVQPESLSVQGISPPDLVVRFGCERNDDLPPEEWPNWSLEFMHNQLYEYFYQSGARWMKRPFSITLARKVRWKTVKHMNRYFSHAERVIDAWREKGPQYLDPQLSYIEGGATPDEVARPHGLYLMRNGVPTNYFAPNFDPPYTTKMTRSLLQNVLDKSWNRKRREWSSEPIPKLVTPSMLMAVACGCADPNAGGYMANQVTRVPSFGAIAPVRGSSMVVSKDAVDFEVASSTVNNVVDVLEEKKTEESEGRNRHSPPDQARMQFNKAATRQSSAASHLSEEFAQSVAVSAYAQSVAASQTTVMHTNLSRQMLRGTMDDDWSTSKAESLDPPGEKVRTDRSILSGCQAWSFASNKMLRCDQSTAWYKKKPLTKPFDKSTLERERQQHNELIAKAKQQTIHQRQQLNPEQLESRSSISMDYSADGSSAFLTLDGSSLIGGQYASDGSILLAPSASAAALASRKHSPKALSRHSEEEEADAASYSLSTQDSSSSVQSIVPSDEELFAVGWAKAMDPRSGNYYYFTLDRTKTVWDNPLSHSAESLDGM
jgi:hypothetical protein